MDDLEKAAAHEITWQKAIWDGDCAKAFETAREVLGELNNPGLLNLTSDQVADIKDSGISNLSVVGSLDSLTSMTEPQLSAVEADARALGGRIR